GYDLPDGSHVYLNMGAEIMLPSGFTQNRTLILKGEGFFDVSHDPSRPFSVKAGNTIITVLGTSFNVKENKSDNMVEVFVESGKVKVRGKDGSSGITLLPGQFGISDGKEPLVSRRDNTNYLSWKTREFRFVNASLDQIIKTLEQAYHVNVDTGNVKVSALKLTSTYYNQSFDSVLETICTAFNLSYTTTDKGYKLTGR
ncbi:MAG TPA: FecR domain-containing protein, partial [Bacteroidales bacterium]|nr:FecR domain-containing protein [Bacteroidales bacterium]